MQPSVWDVGTSSSGDMDLVAPWSSLNTRPMQRTPSLHALSVSSVPTSTCSTDNETIMCESPGCRASFAGKHRRGTLGRHRRLKHRGLVPQEYNCELDGCGKRFQRKDSREKHYRRHHPHMAPSTVTPVGAHRARHSIVDGEENSRGLEGMHTSDMATDTYLASYTDLSLVEIFNGPESLALYGPSVIDLNVDSDRTSGALSIDFRSKRSPETSEISGFVEDEGPGVTKDKRNCCSQCGNTFQRLADLRRHMQQHEEPSWTCEVLGCERNFRRIDKLRDHVRQAHNGNVATEEGCPVIEVPPEAIETSSTCPYPSCDLVFKRQSLLNQHVARKHVRRHHCDECEMAFNLKADLERHKKARHNSAAEAFFKCSEADCSLTFTRQDNLQRHLRRIHGCEDASHTVLVGSGTASGEWQKDELHVDLEQANTPLGARAVCAIPELRSL